jgi:hypothetical protein
MKIARLQGTKIMEFKPVGHIEVCVISVLVLSDANVASDISKNEA